MCPEETKKLQKAEEALKEAKEAYYDDAVIATDEQIELVGSSYDFRLAKEKKQSVRKTRRRRRLQQKEKMQ